MKRPGREAPWRWSGPESSVAVDWHSRHVIKIVWTGRMDLDAMGYFDRVAEMIDEHDGPVHLLYDLLPMEWFNRRILPAHGAFSKQHEGQLGRIAVVTSLATARFAIATVVLLQRRPIRGFADFASGEAWLGAYDRRSA